MKRIREYKRKFKFRRGMLPTGLVVAMLVTSILGLVFSYRVLQVSTTHPSLLAVSPSPGGGGPPRPTTKPFPPRNTPTKPPTNNPTSTKAPTPKPSGGGSNPTATHAPTPKPSGGGGNPPSTNTPTPKPNGGGGGGGSSNTPTPSQGGSNACFSNMQVTSISTTQFTCAFQYGGGLSGAHLNCAVLDAAGINAIAGANCVYGSTDTSTQTVKFTCNTPKNPGKYVVEGYMYPLSQQNPTEAPSKTTGTSCFTQKVDGSITVGSGGGITPGPGGGGGGGGGNATPTPNGGGGGGNGGTTPTTAPTSPTPTADLTPGATTTPAVTGGACFRNITIDFNATKLNGKFNCAFDFNNTKMSKSDVYCAMQASGGNGAFAAGANCDGSKATISNASGSFSRVSMPCVGTTNAGSYIVVGYDMKGTPAGCTGTDGDVRTQPFFVSATGQTTPTEIPITSTVCNVPSLEWNGNPSRTVNALTSSTSISGTPASSLETIYLKIKALTDHSIVIKISTDGGSNYKSYNYLSAGSGISYSLYSLTVANQYGKDISVKMKGTMCGSKDTNVLSTTIPAVLVTGTPTPTKPLPSPTPRTVSAALIAGGAALVVLIAAGLFLAM